MRRILLAVLLVASCRKSAAPARQIRAASDPAPIAVVDTLQGIDRARLDALARRIRSGDEYPNVHSLLVARHGTIVGEYYFGDGSPTKRHTVQSVSKSVTSALVGIALENGVFRGVDEPVLDFFPGWKDELTQDSRRAAMRLEDILTMRTGTDYNESGAGSPHSRLNAMRTGWDRFWLDRPMIHDPGTFWQYDSGGVIAISSMLKNRTRMHGDRFAAEFLFDPMGITDWSWFTNDEGQAHMGGGLALRTRDMMNFGRLYLDHGRWKGEQLVPGAWVDSSFVQRVTFFPAKGPNGVMRGYGYLWWILSPDPEGAGTVPIYAAMGYRGQFIFLIPEDDMVVVVTGWMPPNEGDKPVAFLYSDILPAVVAR